jgi:hypothetical protein
MSLYNELTSGPLAQELDTLIANGVLLWRDCIDNAVVSYTATQ